MNTNSINDDFGFDIDNVTPASSPDPLPNGWYSMTITRAEKIASKSPRAGEMVAIEFEIIAMAHPEHAGRKAWTRLCPHHEDQTPRSIAQQQLAAIRTAANPRARGPADLLGGELQVKLSVKPARTDPATGQTYEAINECKGFRALDGSSTTPKRGASTASNSPASAPAANQAAPSPTQPPARSAGWKR